MSDEWEETIVMSEKRQLSLLNSSNKRHCSSICSEDNQETENISTSKNYELSTSANTQANSGPSR